jgi:hypothetical protein
VLFALAAASTVVFSLSRSLRTRTTLWRIKAASRRQPDAAHAVVIGLGPLAARLIDDLRSMGRHVIAVSSGRTFSVHAEVEDSGALLLEGDARDAAVRARCLLGSAKEVFLTHADDALNLDVAGDILRDVAKGTVTRPEISSTQQDASTETESPRHEMLSCYVHIGDAGYAGLFRGHDLFQASDAVEFHVFNARQRGARQLFLDPEVGLATTYAPSAD